jgi:hypothetical protein
MKRREGGKRAGSWSWRAVRGGCKKKRVIRKKECKAAGGGDWIRKRFAGWERKKCDKVKQVREWRAERRRRLKRYEMKSDVEKKGKRIESVAHILAYTLATGQNVARRL